MRYFFIFLLTDLTLGLEFSMKTSNLVKEGGVEYQQRLSYDPQAEVMMVEVPAHMDVMASVTFFDQKQNLSTVYLPAHKQCQISSMPEDLDVKEMLKFSADYQINGTHFGHENSVADYELNLDTPMSKSQIEKLPAYIQEYCSGSFVTHVRILKVSKEEFHSATFLTFPHESPATRMKRSDFLPMCQLADKCTVKKGWGSFCRWKITKHGDSDTYVRHVYSAEVSCVMCCLDSGGRTFSTVTGFCRCNNIWNKPTYMGCKHGTSTRRLANHG